MKKAIIIIGYKRRDSIERLLRSLERANYDGDTVDLVFSIDNSGTRIVE